MMRVCDGAGAAIQGKGWSIVLAIGLSLAPFGASAAQPASPPQAAGFCQCIAELHFTMAGCQPSPAQCEALCGTRFSFRPDSLLCTAAPPLSPISGGPAAPSAKPRMPQPTYSRQR